MTDSPPRTTPAVAPVGAVSLRPGRVAYLRCDGVPERPGPFPCPRDPVLEAAVWRALAPLERCPLAPGAADVVVDIGADGVATIRARDTFPPEVTRADGAAVLACAGESLQAVRSSLGPERLVVSFRLTLAAPDP